MKCLIQISKIKIKQIKVLTFKKFFHYQKMFYPFNFNFGPSLLEYLGILPAGTSTVPRRYIRLAHTPRTAAVDSTRPEAIAAADRTHCRMVSCYRTRPGSILRTVSAALAAFCTSPHQYGSALRRTRAF